MVLDQRAAAGGRHTTGTTGMRTLVYGAGPPS